MTKNLCKIARLKNDPSLMGGKAIKMGEEGWRVGAWPEGAGGVGRCSRRGGGRGRGRRKERKRREEKGKGKRKKEKKKRKKTQRKTT